VIIRVVTNIAGQQDRDDQRSDDRAEDLAAAAEQAGAPDHHGRDRVEVVGDARGGRRGPEPAHDQDAVDAGQQARDRVDLHQMALPSKPGPDRGLPAVADGVGVGAVPGLGQGEAGDDAEDGGNQHRYRDPAQQVRIAEDPDPGRDG
jgi:hypothetical protein